MRQTVVLLGGALFGLGVVLLGAWVGYTALYEGSLGQPDYAVVDRVDAVEFRHYEPFIVASTPMRAAGQRGLGNGFRVLAGYIFGGNAPGESIAMTAPVLQQQAAGASLPVASSSGQNSQAGRMAFVMPLGRTLSDLPDPDQDDVSLARVDWGDVAAIGFSGAGRQERFEALEVTLRDALLQAGREASGPALYAQYNSPSAFPPLRRNEVLIPLVATATERGP
jgi:hypothetical protein